MRLIKKWRIAQEQPLGSPADDQVTADAEFEQGVRELAIGDPLDEELDLILERR